MQPKQLNELLQNIDIYLLDQILKGRIHSNMKILDAGCGTGRNSAYLINEKFDLTGIDSDKQKINCLQEKFPRNNFLISNVKKMPFKEGQFDYIICNAVLHFAENTNDFFKMLTELFRVLKLKGTLFIRMTSDFGIEDKVKEIKEGVYKIPDGSTRFLLTQKVLKTFKRNFKFDFIEPLKTVNVNDLRCMTTLVIKKNGSITD